MQPLGDGPSLEDMHHKGRDLRFYDLALFPTFPCLLTADASGQLTSCLFGHAYSCHDRLYLFEIVKQNTFLYLLGCLVRYVIMATDRVTKTAWRFQYSCRSSWREGLLNHFEAKKAEPYQCQPASLAVVTQEMQNQDAEALADLTIISTLTRTSTICFVCTSLGKSTSAAHNVP